VDVKYLFISLFFYLFVGVQGEKGDKGDKGERGK
jgi:hypothetical protein